MSWIKNKIRNWLSSNESSGKLSRVEPARSIGSDASLNFSIYEAIGGKIIEFRKYDHLKDRSNNSLYILGKDEDLGEKIAKIITLESLK